MKPIWIVDDDQSISFVLEKALLREELPTRSFTNAREVMLALESANDENVPGPLSAIATSQEQAEDIVAVAFLG